jgi:hypothetical protein
MIKLARGEVMVFVTEKNEGRGEMGKSERIVGCQVIN